MKPITMETVGAYLLMGSALLALVFSNSPWQHYYEALFRDYFYIQLCSFRIKTDLLFIINEGLMSIFFLMVALEIKYELLKGALNSASKAFLPGFAALGGIIVPALFFTAFNYNTPSNLKGWAIPTATDIAFSLGVLSLLGKRIAPAHRIFLSALAILDDLAAIIIIALFYTSQISYFYLTASLLSGLVLILLTLNHQKNLFFYFLTGSVLWYFLLDAGIHPTLAGVALAMAIPLDDGKSAKSSPLLRLKDTLHTPVSLIILPLFAFANAGISLFGITPASLHVPLFFGIFMGLFLGKQLGVFGATWLAVRLKLATLPPKVSWLEIYGLSLLCGLGFTISIFIGTLAFGDLDLIYLNSVKLAVLSGSLLSGLLAYLLFLCFRPQSTSSH
jgi:NhaA family Na+:H+ antiporter